MTYTTAHCNTRSLTHWSGTGIKSTSSWILVRFVSAEPYWELHIAYFYITVYIILTNELVDKLLSPFIIFGILGTEDEKTAQVTWSLSSTNTNPLIPSSCSFWLTMQWLNILTHCKCWMGCWGWWTDEVIALYDPGDEDERYN